MGAVQKFKQLLKSCFSNADVDSKHPIENTRPKDIMSSSQTSSVLTEKTASIKVVATPTELEVSTPLTQQALIVHSKHTYALDNAFPVPEIQSGDEVLIRNCAVGLNPIDWKSVERNFCLPSFPWVSVL